MNEFKYIKNWIAVLPRLGRNTFSLSEVREEFPNKSPSQVTGALKRLTASGDIISVWRGFYAIVLPEYGMRGIVPPIEYIDHLMKHLGKDYYVSALSAAAIHGAAHQKPQSFMFVCDRILHCKEKNETRLVPLLKKGIPHKYVEKKNVRSGAVNVSTPILTAIDLVLYPIKCGGFGNIATVLAELSENIEPGNLDCDFFDTIPASVIQRLGYLLDAELVKNNIADVFMEKARTANVKFRRTPLATYRGVDADGSFYNAKWSVVVNENIEADV